LLAEILAVLTEYDQVFVEPDDLPPPRQFDHAIPLIPGAKPVNLRLYRYSCRGDDYPGRPRVEPSAGWHPRDHRDIRPGRLASIEEPATPAAG
jgi:hypothetical protein